MIQLQGVEIQAGDMRVGPIDFQIEQPAYVIVCGPTGSGKTTLVETLAGLRKQRKGRIVLGGVDVTTMRPADRDIGYVPQDSVLFESMTVRQNLAFGLHARKVRRQEQERIVEFLAARLEIQHLLHRRPFGLSGGERKRVAIGRAIATAPDFLLLDEPFSALDPPTRHSMRQLILDLQLETNCTVVQVSHHEEDINALADVVVHMSGGKIIDVVRRSQFDGELKPGIRESTVRIANFT
ncbi:ATP-binding cassette domain-containing protein [Blastopirellula sp. JC732]|uniref:ATP-binding cassette domain-containing protein n=1 Tax=Blastopirellula sediminis TaxID=2894196 RepID=A0A9X1MKU5_9BACT|nr:ATP-binding cassette domain-containing protein [Blastopirellula sediminis]MCC9608405.1 ATP-binding cassette domain-containing protein [Blastopirellula sediminis]MCC9628818.1 ATP-binding cassette domain-containing protein [Blastopirellula sediminis]